MDDEKTIGDVVLPATRTPSIDPNSTRAPSNRPRPRSSEAPPLPRVGSASRTPLSLSERYTEWTMIDEGGMGHVLLCHDRALDRDVAVKRMRSEYADSEDLRRRFLREVRIQGRLEHPGIVPIYDVGEAEDGAPFFAMKRLQGDTLLKIMRRIAQGDPVTAARYPLRRRIELFENICQTILFAHHQGVVHRDLKPANIIVGEFGEVYVLDWGIAKILGQNTHSSSQHTRTGDQMGTPGYMAPEQAVGSLDVDERADVFSLGVILFELLTLQPLMKGNADEKIRMTLSAARHSPRQRESEFEVPLALDTICVHALSFAPAERTPHVRELHDQIVRWLDGEKSMAERARLAAYHTEQASELLDQNPAMALRELTSALAIDPDNEQAVNHLVQLLAAPADDHSPEANAEIEQGRIDNLLRSSGSAYLAYLGYVPCMAFVYLSGIRSPALWWAFLASFAATAAAGIWVRYRPTLGTFLFATTWGFITLGLSCTFLGPLSLGAAIVVGNGAALILSARASARIRAVLLIESLGALLLPFALAWAGWAPMPYTFGAEGILVQPVIADFDPMWTTFAAVGAAFVSIFATYHLVGGVVDRINESERRTILRARRLEQILPGVQSRPTGDPRISRA